MTTPETPPQPAETAVAVPVAPQPTTPEPPAAPAPKSKLPWIVGAIVLGVLVLAGAAIAAILVFVPAMTGGSAAAPEDAVLAYDRAYDEVDCALYESVTTPDYRETFADSCEVFEAEARTFVDAFTDYEVEVTGSEVDGAKATVTTTETWTLEGQPGSADYVYTLVLDDGVWRIDALE